MNIPALHDLWSWLQKQDQLKKDGLPSEWDQENWFTDWAQEAENPALPVGVRRAHLRRAARTPCGTVCCAAGYVVTQQMGMTPINNVKVEAGIIPDVAEQHLRLTRGQSRALFHSGNTLEDIHKLFVDWGVVDRDGRPVLT